jgi:hypothetical protein
MFGSLLSAAGAVQTILSLGALSFMVVGMVRSSAVTREETQRAGMRSMSWPGAEK